MKITKANSKKENAGYVLYGNCPKTGKWFERWYKTEKTAINYATKRNWIVE